MRLPTSSSALPPPTAAPPETRKTRGTVGKAANLNGVAFADASYDWAVDMGAVLASTNSRAN